MIQWQWIKIYQHLEYKRKTHLLQSSLIYVCMTVESCYTVLKGSDLYSAQNTHICLFILYNFWWTEICWLITDWYCRSDQAQIIIRMWTWSLAVFISQISWTFQMVLQMCLKHPLLGMQFTCNLVYVTLLYI